MEEGVAIEVLDRSHKAVAEVFIFFFLRTVRSISIFTQCVGTQLKPYSIQRTCGACRWGCFSNGGEGGEEEERLKWSDNVMSLINGFYLIPLLNPVTGFVSSRKGPVSVLLQHLRQKIKSRICSCLRRLPYTPTVSSLSIFSH